MGCGQTPRGEYSHAQGRRQRRLTHVALHTRVAFRTAACAGEEPRTEGDRAEHPREAGGAAAADCADRPAAGGEGGGQKGGRRA
eukprot:1987383-Rhodomonas_salina.1